MNRVQLCRKKIKTINEINGHLPSGWKALLCDSIIGHLGDPGLTQGVARLKKLGDITGQLCIKHPDGWTFTIFDWNPGLHPDRLCKLHSNSSEYEMPWPSSQDQVYRTAHF